MTTTDLDPIQQYDRDTAGMIDCFDTYTGDNPIHTRWYCHKHTEHTCPTGCPHAILEAAEFGEMLTSWSIALDKLWSDITNGHYPPGVVPMDAIQERWADYKAARAAFESALILHMVHTDGRTDPLGTGLGYGDYAPDLPPACATCDGTGGRPNPCAPCAGTGFNTGDHA